MRMRPYRRISMLLAVLALGLMAAGHARAQQCTDCSCVHEDHAKTRDFKDQQANKTRALDLRNVTQQEDWLLNTVWLGYPGFSNPGGTVPGILPTLQHMADQLVDTGMYQTFAVGTMLDSQQQIQTERLLNRLTARAEKDYQTDVGMCTFGTEVRSLPAAERRGEYVRYVLSQRSQDRQLGHRNAIGADGMHYDLRARLAQFRTRYCSKLDDNGALQTVCDAKAANAPTHNADINYAALVDQPLTMNVDLTDNITPAGPTDPSQGYSRDDVFALADNLYASDILTRIYERAFKQEEKKQLLVDLRSTVAKRSVAENSFYTIIGMKSSGSINQSANQIGNADVKITSADSAKYVKPILKQLGVPDADQDNMIGKNPSYFAQMDVLSKLVYQRPEFYTDLYESPENTERKSAAMMAVQLMQNFDRWESSLRQESMMAVWLELDLKKYQDRVVNTIHPLEKNGQEVTPSQ